MPTLSLAGMSAQGPASAGETHVRSLHQLCAASSPGVPSSLMERSKQSKPPSLTWWYDTATATSDSGIFRLRACSRVVIAVHAASEALSNSSGPPPRGAAAAVGAAIENTDAP